MKDASSSEGDNRFLIAHYFALCLGIFVGAVVCIGGITICLTGLSGDIEWILEAVGLKSKMINATPGVVIAMLGVLILWRYRPRPFKIITSKKEEETRSSPKVNQDEVFRAINWRHEQRSVRAGGNDGE